MDSMNSASNAKQIHTGTTHTLLNRQEVLWHVYYKDNDRHRWRNRYPSPMFASAHTPKVTIGVWHNRDRSRM